MDAFRVAIAAKTAVKHVSMPMQASSEGNLRLVALLHALRSQAGAVRDKTRGPGPVVLSPYLSLCSFIRYITLIHAFRSQAGAVRDQAGGS